MEELITTVILVFISFTLEVRDIVPQQTRVAAYHEAEKDNNKTASEKNPHHRLHSMRGEHLTGKKSLCGN
jgi:hypothetical protein